MHVLFVSSNPPWTQRLDLADEMRELMNGLQGQKVQLMPIPAAQRMDVKMAVTSTPVKILHFCGHATKEEGIILRDEVGHEDPVKLDTLLAKADRIKLVVLNACNTQSSADAIRESVDAVIFTTRELKDDAGKLMTRVLYSELRSGKSIDEAFKAGALAIDEAGFNRGHAEPCYKIYPESPKGGIFDKPTESTDDKRAGPTLTVENKPTYDKFFFVNYLDEQIRSVEGRIKLNRLLFWVLFVFGGILLVVLLNTENLAEIWNSTIASVNNGDSNENQLFVDFIGVERIDKYLGKPYLDSLLAIGAGIPAFLSILQSRLVIHGNQELRSLTQMKELAKRSEALSSELQDRLQKIMDQCIRGANEDYRPLVDWYGLFEKVGPLMKKIKRLKPTFFTTRRGEQV